MVPYIMAHLQVSPRGWVLIALALVIMVLAVATGVHFMDASATHQMLAARYHSGPLALGANNRYHS